MSAPSAANNFAIDPSASAEVEHLALEVLKRGVVECGRAADWRSRRLLVVAALGLLANAIAAIERFDAGDLERMAQRMNSRLDSGIFVAEVIRAWGADGEAITDIEQAALFGASADETHRGAAEEWIARHPQYRAGLVARQITATVH